jgi:oxalate decarboxylase
MTVFESGGSASMVDYRTEPVTAAYVTFAIGHHVQKTGDETLTFLEGFCFEHLAEVSLASRWAYFRSNLPKFHSNSQTTCSQSCLAATL